MGIKNKLIIIAVFIVLDIITGLIKAFATTGYNSSVMRAGLYHKSAEILAIAFGYLCDYAIPIIGISLPFDIVNGVILYITLMESGSIIENIGMLSPELGGYLSKFFEKVNHDQRE